MHKRFLLVFSFLVSSLTGFSQIAPTTENSIFMQGVKGCYSDYYIEFYNRGANKATDGEYEVVISIINTNNSQSECYMGKATVQNGKLMTPVYIQKTDGSYMPLNRMIKALDQNWLDSQDMNTISDVSDGMTTLFYTQEKYWVRLFFPSLINSKSVSNQKAPPAKELLKSGN
ncbi:MAG: hypothetical protein HWE15_11420 [Algoriphagus sp.]|uniref:hypothetical protein n=1 Tax=Algoriphagus sp. TaxID=1872435 RepID=UPI0017977985|nr:hypothetical protein [Algoriphagus sp.]NVJ86908.1 hypothetical protein [Algoriphagus sp.]